MKKYFLPLCFLLLSAAPVKVDNDMLFRRPANDLQLYLPEDLEANIWAESPMFYNPTNIDVDAKGRIWLTEAVNYRNFNNDSAKFLHRSEGDRIMILEDSDHDGKADKTNVFVEDKDLISPLGIAVIGNKTIVSCSPNLIIYTDENGDDKPDKKEIFLTGFGGKDHDHSLHSLVTGPDGKWFFNTGNAGPHIVKDKAGWNLKSGSIYTGGSPYNNKNQGGMKSDDGRIWVGGLALRINPDGTGLKVVGHNFRNSYEVCIDSYGDMWQNDNDDQVVTCRTSWLPEGGNAGYFSTDGTRYWQADQRPGQDMFTAHWHQDDPGVMPAGDKTGAGSPTGIVLNEGDGLGEKYRGMLLSADAGRNVIFSYKPEIKGAGYELNGKRQNFITSLNDDNKGYIWNDADNDTDQKKWFRPSDVMVGTDGALYIADWFDPVVGGHQMKDFKGFGRIYKITPKGKKLNSPVLNLKIMAGKIEALKNPAINVRNAAFISLKKESKKAIKPVKELLNSANPYHQARAIWLLSQLGDKGVSEVLENLNNKDEKIRLVSYRALKEIYSTDQILAIAKKLSSDPSLLVRREVVASMRDIPLEKSQVIINTIIAGYQHSDPWFTDAIGMALLDKEEKYFPVLLSLYKTNDGNGLQNSTFADLIWRLHPVAAVPILNKWINDPKTDPKDVKRFIIALGFIKNKSAAEAMLALSKNKDQEIASQASYWLAFRQGNDWFDLLDWKTSGIDLEHEKQVAKMRANKEKLLDEHIAFWDRNESVKAMAKDAIGGQMLIGMAADKLIPADLKATIESLIFNNPDQGVRVQASNYFKRPGVGKVFSINEINQLKPDAITGKTVFINSCSACHRVGKTGNDIGPELTLINKKFDRTSLLDAIINPSAGIVFGYEPWLISTKDGETIFGFMVADGAQTVVIKDLSGKKHNIPASKITSRQKQEKSLMPEPVSLGLTEKNLADLAAYLLTLK